VNSARIRKALDRLAYASLVLDVCIAIITAIGVLDVRASPQPLLFPIDYLLTIVVVLSIIMFIVLLFFRSMEKRAEKAIERAQSPT
jgi:flagellar biosynthesis protein FliR